MCVHGALIAGSTAKIMVGETDIESHDYDLLVPHRHWQKIAMLIPQDATPTKFGGWRFEVEEAEGVVEVDVWPSDLQTYLTECRTKYGGDVVVVDFIRNRVFSSRCQELTL
jgi:hypothetical protein